MKLTQLDNNRFVAILYGKAKVGKTVLASQFPNLFFIDLDRGLGSVLTIRTKLGLDFDFDVLQLDDEPTTDEIFVKYCGKTMARQSAWLKLKAIVGALVKKLPQDTTLVIDNLSRAGEFLTEHLKKTTGHSPLQIQDWGTFKDEMLGFIGLVLSSSAVPNVIIIAHEQLVKDELSGAIERTILVAGQSAHRIPTVADEFWYMRADQKIKANKRTMMRVLQNQADRITNSGSRCWMPDIENPTYEKMKPYLEMSLGRKLPDPTWTLEEEEGK